MRRPTAAATAATKAATTATEREYSSKRRPGREVGPFSMNSYFAARALLEGECRKWVEFSRWPLSRERTFGANQAGLFCPNQSTRMLTQYGCGHERNRRMPARGMVSGAGTDNRGMVLGNSGTSRREAIPIGQSVQTGGSTPRKSSTGQARQRPRLVRPADQSKSAVPSVGV